MHRGRGDLDGQLLWLAENTNADGFTGPLKQAVVGADVFIGVSVPGVIDANDVAAMAPDVVFALANPVPEIDPGEAIRFATVVATGRSDFPNQINNVLAFPGVFRGLLDAQLLRHHPSHAAGRRAGARIGSHRRRAQPPTSCPACSIPTYTRSWLPVRTSAGSCPFARRDANDRPGRESSR